MVGNAWGAVVGRDAVREEAADSWGVHRTRVVDALFALPVVGAMVVILS
jgi:hypothetical protein